MPPLKWTTAEDLRPHLDPIVAELERMPTRGELVARGQKKLLGPIRKFDGPQAVAASLNYPYDVRKSRSTRRRSLEDLRRDLDPIVDQYGHLPGQLELKRIGRPDLSGAIERFGGFRPVAEALGYLYHGPRSWKSIEDLRSHLDPIVAELERMPTTGELRALNRYDLINANAKFKGPRNVAKTLGYLYDPEKARRVRWKNAVDLKPFLDPIVAQLKRMPTKRELQSRAPGGVSSAIHKFGGYAKVAAVLGYPYEGPQRRASVEDLRAELDPIVAELDRMPGQLELRARGRDDLLGAIHRFGGIPRVAEALGYPYLGPKHRPDIEHLRVDLDHIVAELGRMPKNPELQAMGRFDLMGAIAKFGGYPKVAEELGYHYVLAPGLARRESLRRLEAALTELHVSQELNAGMVMLILRHAGLLTRGHVAEVVGRLGAARPFAESTVSDLLAAVEAAGVGDQEASGTLPVLEALEKAQEPDDPGPDRLLDSEQPDIDVVQVDAGARQEHPGRDRQAEILELRGWSHVGNLVDPTPALVQLMVGRLKTAFYRFANDAQDSPHAPSKQATDMEVAKLRQQLYDSAFAAYGELLNNDLVREASAQYVAELADALLLPRQEMRFRPRLYQLDGARFVSQRILSGECPYGLLFDQPGMGKTLTTLWGLAAGGAERIAIVAPLTVKREVWTIDQIRQAFPQLSPDRFAAGLDAALALPATGPAVAVLHYEELRRHDAIHQLTTPRSKGSLPFDAVVFDEAHEVKERLSISSRGPTRTGAWLLRQGARACIGLTATPVVNELFEPVSLLHLVQGRRDSDAGRRLQSRRLRDRVDVMEYLLADSLRRLKPDVLFEIPPREIRVHEIVPDASQLARLETFLSRGRRAMTAQLAEYRRLMLEAKLDWVAGTVQGNATAVTPEGLPDPKTLVLCYNVEGVSRSVYERLVAELGAERVLHVDGSTPEAERKDAFRRFREPADAEKGVVALVGSVGTVGVGVTLFDADEQITPHRVVFADLPYTWAEFEQGIDRLHRVGQRFPVRVDVPLVTFGEHLVHADGEPLQSFDQWVWDWIRRKQRLADQVLDAAFDISEYQDSQIRKAISRALKAIEESGGAVIAPAPPPESAAAEHRRQLGRLRGLPRQRAAERFEDPAASQQFLTANDASTSARLAQRLVRERLSRWLDRRSVVVDLGCGSNPLRDLPCERVIGIDRHGVNGGLIGDSADTGLPPGDADFVVMSLSMWGTPEDRLAYLREAKRLLRPIGKLVVVEPRQPFGGAEHRQAGAARFATVVAQLGMRLAEQGEYAVDAGTSLLAFVVDNSAMSADATIDHNQCDWHE
jgi:superfamily II DNA or RNA helicase